MLDKGSEIRPDGQSLGLPDYLVWLGNQLTASAVGAFGTLGVGFLEARVLIVLGRRPNLIATSLVQHLGVDRSAISRALQQLKSAGMVVADDLRRLSLSDAGWAKYKEVEAIANERLARLTADLADADLQQLLILLLRLHRNVPHLLEFKGDRPAGGRGRRAGHAALRE
jgi:DNA-binding MarR family transcriptional regulator